jgi:hypothetical protein
LTAQNTLKGTPLNRTAWGTSTIDVSAKNITRLGMAIDSSKNSGYPLYSIPSDKVQCIK